MPPNDHNPLPSDLPLTLLTLGGASLVSPSTSGPERPLLGPGKPLALLVYLACAPRRTSFRDHLVDLLWADVAPEKGRHALRQTIWYIKRQVGESLLGRGRGAGSAERAQAGLALPTVATQPAPGERAAPAADGVLDLA